MIDLDRELGGIDIYLLDQVMRKNVPAGARILDAGCGSGRNLVYFLRAGHEVFAVDTSPDAVASARKLAPHLPETSFRVEPIESMTFPPESVDVVLSSAVLHFSRDDDHFWAMLHAMWGVLASGGLFFCRLASTIGMESRMTPVSGRRFFLPDGSERYLVDEALLEVAAKKLKGTLVEPLFRRSGTLQRKER